MISVQNLQKNIGKLEVLKNISFEAPQGSITGFLGPNGAGKSTTLRIISGVLCKDHGEIKVNGLDPAISTLEVRSQLGILGDHRGLYGRLTTRENIFYYGKLHHLTNEVIEQRLEKLMNILEMQDIIDRRTEGFSTGQKVKVAMARSLIHDPQYIILDEPTSGLDVMATIAVRKFIKSLKSMDKCIIFCSHIMQEVGEICDRIVVINEGQTFYNGTLQDLLLMTGTNNMEQAFMKTVLQDHYSELQL